MQIEPGNEKLFLDIWHFNLTVTQCQGFWLLTEHVLGFGKLLTVLSCLWAIQLNGL